MSDSDNRIPGFVAHMVEKTSLSPSTIYDSLSRASAFTDEQGEILKRAGVSKTDATKLARLDETRRNEILEALADGRIVSVKEMLSPAQPDQAITIYQADQARPVWSLDLAIDLWLDAKFKHSSSSRTRHAYEITLQEFRAALQFQGLDLDSVATQSDRVAMQVTRDKVKQLAQVFAGFSKRGRQVKESTINHRLSVISSFYAFCMLNEWLDYNPIAHLQRSKVEPYADVKALDFDEVSEAFDRLDMSKEEDVRDSALLAILLQTGRRASEVAGLRWKHATVRKGLVTLFFERCKGNKTAQDELSKEASTALLRWLHMHYGRDLARLPGDTPLFVSLARGKSYGYALSIQAIGQICLKRLGTSKVHSTRHTFVMGMFESGASPREVQAKLLHSSLHTTSLYGDKLQSAKNQHAGKLSQLFGIK